MEQTSSLLRQSRAGVVAAMVAACGRTQGCQAAMATAVAQALASPVSKVPSSFQVVVFYHAPQVLSFEQEFRAHLLDAQAWLARPVEWASLPSIVITGSWRVASILQCNQPAMCRLMQICLGLPGKSMHTIFAQCRQLSAMGAGSCKFHVRHTRSVGVGSVLSGQLVGSSCSEGAVSVQHCPAASCHMGV